LFCSQNFLDVAGTQLAEAPERHSAKIGPVFGHSNLYQEPSRSNLHRFLSRDP